MDNSLPSQRSNDDLRVDGGERAMGGGRSAEESGFDAAVHQALLDVPFPQRLLARLASIPDLAPRRDVIGAAIAAEATASEATGATGKVEPASKSARSGAARLSRRTAIGASLALTAALCAAGFLLFRSATDFEDWNDEVLARRAIAWTSHLEKEAKNRDAWGPVAPQQVERTLGLWIRRPPEATGTYRLTGTYDRRFTGQVYRFGSVERSDAMLFVVDASTLPGDLHASPPATPSWTSEGFAVGMWRRGDHLYVLAVRGDADDYARLIRRQVVA